MDEMIEFFSGCGIMAQTFRDNGYTSTTIDSIKEYKPTLCFDVLDPKIDFLPFNDIDVMWLSPPCQGFSVAQIGRNWHKDTNLPKTETAKIGLKLLEFSIKQISLTQPQYWFIENPRGKMRKVIDKIFAKYGITRYKRHTVTYCQYGENRMKPTDIWTNNHNWIPRKPCKNGDPCHEPAPRGSQSGTQGMKNSFEKAKLPKQLCEEIFVACLK